MIRVGVNLQKINIDPITAINFQDYTAIDLIHEPLVYFDPNSNVFGALAENWSVNPDGTEYVFNLRETRFHNGSRVTSEDVIETFGRHLRKDSGSYLRENLLSVLADVGRPIEALGKNRVKFTLKGAYPGFLELLSAVYILPQVRGDMGVGAGPYRLIDFSETSLRLERDRMNKSSDIQALELRTIQTHEYQKVLLSGEVDLAIQAPLNVTTNPPSDYHVFQSPADRVSVWAYFNLSKSVWQNKENRIFMQETLWLARNESGFLSLFDRPMNHFVDLPESKIDVIKHSLKKPKSFPDKIRLIVPNTFFSRNAIQNIRQKMIQNGIEVEFVLGKGKELFDPVSQGDFDIAFVPYEIARSDPDELLFLITPDAPLIRYFHLPTRHYLDELNLLKFLPDKTDRRIRYQEVFLKIERESLVVPLFSQRMPFLYLKHRLRPFEGYSRTPLGLRFWSLV